MNWFIEDEQWLVLLSDHKQLEYDITEGSQSMQLVRQYHYGKYEIKTANYGITSQVLTLPSGYSIRVLDSWS